MTLKDSSHRIQNVTCRMSQKTIIRRLTLRLAHIRQWIDQQDTYHDIWDLCCDHGHLGLHLHQNHTLTHVHLIDKIPSIIHKIRKKYTSLIDSRLHMQQLDAQDIVLTGTPRQMIVIAGIGGGTVKSLLQAIIANPKNASQHAIDFIISPNAHTFELRNYLRNNIEGYVFELINEAFISDNNKHHEHIFVRLHPQKKDIKNRISTTGRHIWQPFDSTKEEYLEKLIKHYTQINAFKRTPLSIDAEKKYTGLLNHLKSNRCNQMLN